MRLGRAEKVGGGLAAVGLQGGKVTLAVTKNTRMRPLYEVSLRYYLERDGWR